MKSQYKVMVLIVIAVLAMSALAYVNLQKVRETSPRATSFASETAMPGWRLTDAP